MVFKFNRISPGDPAKTFAGLSKTIRDVAEQVGTLDRMAANERKAHDAHQRDLDSLFGVVGKGISQEGYELLVQEQNAIAQREGVIKAYENFSYLDSVDKERAKIRLSAYQKELQQHIPAMSNATTPLDFETAEGAVYDALGDSVLGVDSTGNEVRMELDSQRTGEMVAMSRGLTQQRTAVTAAVEDMRQEQAIKSSEVRFQQEFHDLLVDTGRLRTTAGLGEDAKGVMSEEFRRLSDEYFGYGVTNINELQLKAVQSYAINQATSGLLTPTLEDEITAVLVGLVDTYEVREGAGPFAAEGTDNNVALQGVLRNVATVIDSREREQVALLKANDLNVESELQSFVLNSIASELEQNDGRVGRDFERQLNIQLIVQANALGYTDPDKIIGNFDGVLSNLDSPSHEKFVARTLHDVNFTDDLEELRIISFNAYQKFTDGTITLDDYKTSLNAVKSKQAKLSATATTELERARREGGFGSSTVRTSIGTAAEDILKLNDRKLQIGTAFAPEFATVGGEDNDQLVANRIKVERAWIADKHIALTGGTIPPVADVTVFTEQEKRTLGTLRTIEVAGKPDVTSGVDVSTLASLEQLTQGLTLTAPDPNDDVAIQHNLARTKERALQYSQYLAMRRLLDNMETANTRQETAKGVMQSEGGIPQQEQIQR